MRVLTGSWDKTARLWDAATGKEIRAFKGHEQPVLSVTFSPEGMRVLTGSWDNTGRLWDAVTGKEIRAFKGHKGSVNSVAFSPDGMRVLTGSADDTARLWDAVTGKEIRAFEGHEDFIDFRRLRLRWHARADRIIGRHRPPVGRGDGQGNPRLQGA